MQFSSTRTTGICVALVLGGFITLACGSGASKATLVGTPVASQLATSSANSTGSVATTDGTSVTAPVSTDAASAAMAPTVVKQDFKLGDIINLDGINMTVIGWENLAATDMAKPDAGNKFVAVELVMVNSGSKPTAIASVFQTKLKDSEGQQYDPDFKAAMAGSGSTPSGTLAVGEKLRGKVGFQVPETAANLIFVYDVNLFSAGKLFVNLGAEPTTVEVPSSLPGETPQQASAIGEPLDVGKMILTVNKVTTPKGSAYVQPAKGHKFMVIDLTLENKDTKAANVSSLLQMAVKDKQGYQYAPSFSATQASGGKAPDGEIAPGEKIKGQVGFEIPDDAEDLFFTFDGNLFDASKVFIKIS